jgi:hypothetical protein
MPQTVIGFGKIRMMANGKPATEYAQANPLPDFGAVLRFQAPLHDKRRMKLRHAAALALVTVGLILQALAILAAFLDFVLEGWPFTAIEYHDVAGAFLAFLEIAGAFCAGIVFKRLGRRLSN